MRRPRLQGWSPCRAQPGGGRVLVKVHQWATAPWQAAAANTLASTPSINSTSAAQTWLEWPGSGARLRQRPWASPVAGSWRPGRAQSDAGRGRRPSSQRSGMRSDRGSVPAPPRPFLCQQAGGRSLVQPRRRRSPSCGSLWSGREFLHPQTPGRSWCRTGRPLPSGMTARHAPAGWSPARLDLAPCLLTSKPWALSCMPLSAGWALCVRAGGQHDLALCALLPACALLLPALPAPKHPQCANPASASARR